MILTIFRKLYSKLKIELHFALRNKQTSNRQADALATKLDITGVFFVTQAWLGITQYGWSFWFAVALFILSTLVCVIFWIIAFILKGYEK